MIFCSQNCSLLQSIKSENLYVNIMSKCFTQSKKSANLACQYTVNVFMTIYKFNQFVCPEYLQSASHNLQTVKILHTIYILSKCFTQSPNCQSASNNLQTVKVLHTISKLSECFTQSTSSVNLVWPHWVSRFCETLWQYMATQSEYNNFCLCLDKNECNF